MKDLQRHRVWEIVEFFHHEFSHLLITISAVLIVVSYAVIEINHSSHVSLTSFEIKLIIVSGVIMGIVLALASIEGRIAKIMFYVLFLLIIGLIAVFHRKDVEYRYLPFAFYTVIMLIVSLLSLALYGYKKKGFPEIVDEYFFD